MINVTSEERILASIFRNPTAHDFFKLYTQQFIKHFQNNLGPHPWYISGKQQIRAEMLILLAVVTFMRLWELSPDQYLPNIGLEIA